MPGFNGMNAYKYELMCATIQEKPNFWALLLTWHALKTTLKY
jgi:hypothetical protein